MGFVVGLPTIILICSSMYECYAYIFNKHEENENQEQNMDTANNDQFFSLFA